MINDCGTAHERACMCNKRAYIHTQSHAMVDIVMIGVCKAREVMAPRTCASLVWHRHCSVDTCVDPQLRCSPTGSTNLPSTNPMEAIPYSFHSDSHFERQ